MAEYHDHNWNRSAHTARRRSVTVIVRFRSDLDQASVRSKPCAVGIHQDGSSLALPLVRVGLGN